MILSLVFIIIATETQAEHLVETLSGPVIGEDRWGWDSRFNIKVNYTAYVVSNILLYYWGKDNNEGNSIW